MICWADIPACRSSLPRRRRVHCTSPTSLLQRLNLLPHPATLLLPITATHNLLLSLSSSLPPAAPSPPLSPFPAGATSSASPPHSSAGSLFFCACLFYLSKILEFSDTLLILLGPTCHRHCRLSFLRVDHHATVVVMSYLWLDHSHSQFPIVLVPNAVVHVMMYGCYFLYNVGCGRGRSPTYR